MNNPRLNSAVIKLAREKADKLKQPIRIFRDRHKAIHFGGPRDWIPATWVLVDTVEPSR